MRQEEIERLWKIASNDPNHDTNWHDPVVIAFARLLERRILSMDNPHLRIALDSAQDKARKDEREACADLRNMLHGFDGKGRQEMVDAMNRGLDEYQALIKARGQA